MRIPVSLIALAALSSSAAAEPVQLSHQGRMYDSSGAPLTGLHDVDFILYDAPA